MPNKIKNEGLEPCPFCGSDGIAIYSKYTHGWRVRCVQLNCCNFPSKHFTKENAVNQWNRRME